MAFIFGGDTGMTYEQMLRQRSMAEQLTGGIDRVQGPGGGLNALAKGFAAGVLNKRANKAETQGKEAAAAKQQSALAALFGRSLGGGAQMAPAQAQNAPQGAGLPASLIQSESGGNLSALNSEGYGGRGQFGEARLADAARAGIIPAGMTGATYAQQPEQVQRAVEQWHRADILGNLGQYVGTDVDGPGPIPPLTEDSLLAVAHLGGTGGARKFVESGGQYNPSDSNGTSLADYAMRHAGNGTGPVMGNYADPMQGVDMAAVTAALSDPYLDQGSKSVLAMMLQDRIGQRDAIQQQQMRMQDPMYQAQLQQAQLQNQALMNPQASAQMPSEVQALQWRAEQAGLQPGTQEYQDFIMNGGSRGTGVPAGFAALDAQAKAGGLTPGTPEYQAFMLGSGAGQRAEATETGKARGQAATGLSGITSKAERAIENLQAIRNDPALPGITGMVQGRMPPMTQAGTDLNTRIQQAQGQAFLEAFDSLKGGGAITEIEGLKAEQAMARLNRAQSTEAYQSALDELTSILDAGVSRAYDRAGQVRPTAQPSQPQAPQQGQRLRFNPATGEFE